MENKELNKVTAKVEDVIFGALENGATQEELIKILDYVKHEVENFDIM